MFTEIELKELDGGRKSKWRIIYDLEKGCAIVDEDDKVIAIMVSGRNEPQHPDGLLMSCSPELLEEVKQLREGIAVLEDEIIELECKVKELAFYPKTKLPKYLAIEIREHYYPVYINQTGRESIIAGEIIRWTDSQS